MAGLARLCKLYGKLQVNDTMWVYDYYNDKPVLEKNFSKEDRKKSEKAKFEMIKKNL